MKTLNDKQLAEGYGAMMITHQEILSWTKKYYISNFYIVAANAPHSGPLSSPMMMRLRQEGAPDVTLSMIQNSACVEVVCYPVT
jgi:hypothetical protein